MLSQTVKKLTLKINAIDYEQTIRYTANEMKITLIIVIFIVSSSLIVLIIVVIIYKVK